LDFHHFAWLGVKHKARGPNSARHVILRGPWRLEKTHFFKKLKKNILCFYFEGFKLSYYVIILETFSYVEYLYTQINNNKMQ